MYGMAELSISCGNDRRESSRVVLAVDLTQTIVKADRVDGASR